ncbi:DUF6230 family protein [Streptomyces sp. NPDC052396]|uniref:DUF6230 family protein n=1 Tax=Streptomyces sp. NPDC052396 TaxID=3365689 RepID=UPI0037D5C299
MSAGTGALAVAFAGGLPVTVYADKVEVTGVSVTPGITPGGVPRPALVAQADKAVVTGACVTSTAHLPAIGATTVSIKLDRGDIGSVSVQPGAVKARKVTAGGAGLTTPDQSEEKNIGLFTVTAGHVTAEGVTAEPQAFAVGTVTVHVVDIKVSTGTRGCTPDWAMAVPKRTSSGEKDQQ